MTETELQAILARNPQVKSQEHIQNQPHVKKAYLQMRAETYDTNLSSSTLSPPEPERRAQDALDQVAQEETGSKTRPFVRFTFYRTRLLDVDARAHGAKDLLDGLIDSGLLPGDREDQIDFEASQKKVHYKKDERIEIEILIP